MGGDAPGADSRSSPRGFFVSLDGPDGGGKSTQAARLSAALRAWGYDVVLCRDPGGTQLGERLRSLLLDHDKDGLRIGLRAEMLLYMASRAQLVEELIGPALAEGRLVVCDRFLMANVVYQAHAGGLDPGEVWAVGQIATGGVLPDLTLVLDVPPEVAAARRGPARDRMEARTEAYHRAVRAGYLRELESRRVAAVRIDAAADEETVAARILDEVRRALERRAGT